MQFKLMKEVSDPTKTSTSMVLGLFEDGIEMWIPNDPGNRFWQTYQAWLSEGNTPIAADANWQ